MRFLEDNSTVVSIYGHEPQILILFNLSIDHHAYWQLCLLAVRSVFAAFKLKHFFMFLSYSQYNIVPVKLPQPPLQ